MLPNQERVGSYAQAPGSAASSSSGPQEQSPTFGRSAQSLARPVSMQPPPNPQHSLIERASKKMKLDIPEKPIPAQPDTLCTMKMLDYLGKASSQDSMLPSAARSYITRVFSKIQNQSKTHPHRPVQLQALYNHAKSLAKFEHQWLALGARLVSYANLLIDVEPELAEIQETHPDQFSSPKAVWGQRALYDLCQPKFDPSQEETAPHMAPHDIGTLVQTIRQFLPKSSSTDVFRMAIRTTVELGASLAKVDAFKISHGKSHAEPLLMANQHQNLDLVTALVLEGADPNIRSAHSDMSGRTVLNHAISHDYPASYQQTLLAYGAHER